MLVVDASAIAELLLDTPTGHRVAALIEDQDLMAPQLLAVEVASVLRGWVLGRGLSPTRAQDALEDLADLGIDWEDLPPLIDGIWSLRHNLSCYDAAYVVLARAVSCKLLTCDERLARVAPDVAFLP